MSWLWWLTLVIQHIGKLRQEVCYLFKASLGYTARLYLKKGRRKEEREVGDQTWPNSQLGQELAV